MNFTYPLYVASEGRDALDIKVLESSFFMSKATNETMPGNYTLEVEVPPQAKSAEDANLIAEVGRSARFGLLFSLLIPFCFMLFMSVSMDTVWGFYNML